MTLKVLLVDDDAVACRGMQTLIPWEGLGATVIGTAANGKTALDLAFRLRPDIILTDIQMPVMDGLDLCRIIRQETLNTSIIVLSAHEKFEYARTAMQYGVRHYIVKPVTVDKIEELKRIIGEIQETNRLRQESIRMTGSGWFKELIRIALHAGNSECVEEKLHAVLRKYEELEQSVLIDTCARAIETLIEVLQEEHLEPEALGISRTALETLVVDSRTKQDIYKETCRLFRDICARWARLKQSNTSALIRHLKDLIEAQYSDLSLTVRSLGEQLHFSPSYLTGLFREHTGQSLNHYLTSVRIDKAQRLLEDPAKTVAEISVLVGYLDSHYFTRVFKKRKGMTPSEYRNLKLGARVEGGR